jgi:hypothetical protein
MNSGQAQDRQGLRAFLSTVASYAIALLGSPSAIDMRPGFGTIVALWRRLHCLSRSRCEAIGAGRARLPKAQPGAEQGRDMPILWAEIEPVMSRDSMKHNTFSAAERTRRVGGTA